MRCCGSAFDSVTPPIQMAAIAKVTPPTQVELPTPAATTSTNVASSTKLSRRISSESSSIASTTHEADAMCCGTQADWNSQPAKPVCGMITELMPGMNASSGRSDPVAQTSRTSNAASLRPLIQMASPTISISDAKALNQVSAASASQPLMPSNSDSSAALKWRR